jgi:hypothetical protein
MCHAGRLASPADPTPVAPLHLSTRKLLRLGPPVDGKELPRSEAAASSAEVPCELSRVLALSDFEETIREQFRGKISHVTLLLGWECNTCPIT